MLFIGKEILQFFFHGLILSAGKIIKLCILKKNFEELKETNRESVVKMKR